jgi:hypothetical protein
VKTRLSILASQKLKAARNTSLMFKPYLSTMLATDVNGQGHYLFEISAQNGKSTEQLWFRRSKTGQGSAYRFIVFRYLTGKPHEKVREIDWTEPTKQP